MKFTTPVTYLLIGAFVFAPFSVFAEENSGDQGTQTAVSTTAAPEPTLYREGPSKQELLREIPPRREPQNGGMVRPIGKVATGTRMLASSTRPLPPFIEKRIEKREEKMEERRPDCAIKGGTVSSTSDCIGEKRENRVEARTERREEIRERVTERRGEVLRALANLLVTRMNVAIERETTLANRIDSRIAKHKSEQINTSVAEAKMIIVRTKLADARMAVTSATTKIQDAVSDANIASSTAGKGDPGKYLREELSKAKQSVQEAHKSLIEALNALKANKKATTTPESNRNSTN